MLRGLFVFGKRILPLLGQKENALSGESAFSTT
ncbi:hypothetical protein SAMN05216293_2154 [Flagellimonas taeanensis]|uniref:Uncharacterized protein n=1 Tax=Flagellimonas taeanensis TaxID=1005926 RepID=A0A1M6W4P0_9FLAO|nr:hypothetical protein SAMN05216293_2154 [Allomuricauda taeanensis]